MLFIAGVVAFLAIRATAQESCETCRCTIDNCLQELVGTLPFIQQTTVSDCRSFLWTSSTVGATTVTVTIEATAVTATSNTVPAVTATDIPAYAAACSNAAAYSSACECVGVITGGTTFIQVESTTTTVIKPAATPDTSCGSAGLEVAIFNNPYVSATTGYPEFSPEHFKNVAPYDTDKTDAVGINSAAEMNNPHGFTPATASIYVLNYRGFFYSPNTTTYTFRLSNADDYAGFWTGSKAQTGWTRANEDGESTYRAPANPPIVAQIQLALTAGEYTPLRLIFANRGGTGKYTFEVFDSAGFNYVEYGAASPFLVSYSCLNPSEAPAYADPFGGES
ncbi:hypothetical protein TWF481_010305 [Arthrobotrys musiformis]|uniref:PA14 domain-containing protein n=1 Tax=Arthrobotrys musiformis TaxID=47236 RepID=A0AAV9W0D5_9PEZI